MMEFMLPREENAATIAQATVADLLQPENYICGRGSEDDRLKRACS